MRLPIATKDVISLVSMQGVKKLDMENEDGLFIAEFEGGSIRYRLYDKKRHYFEIKDDPQSGEVMISGTGRISEEKAAFLSFSFKMMEKFDIPEVKEIEKELRKMGALIMEGIAVASIYDKDLFDRSELPDIDFNKHLAGLCEIAESRPEEKEIIEAVKVTNEENMSFYYSLQKAGEDKYWFTTGIKMDRNTANKIFNNITDEVLDITKQLGNTNKTKAGIRL